MEAGNAQWSGLLDTLILLKKTVPMLDPNATDRMVWFDAER